MCKVKTIYFLLVSVSWFSIQELKNFLKVLHLNDQLSFKYFYASIIEVFIKDSDL